VKKGGLVKSNKTIYGKVILGNFVIPAVVLLSYLLSVIPWDKLYNYSWYRQFVELVSYVSVNIPKIINSPLAFSQYAISFLAFIGVVGTLYFLFSIYMGVKHMRFVRQTYGIYELDHLGVTKKIIYLFALFCAIGVLLWGALVFSGEASIKKGLYYNSKFSFVFMFTLTWCVLSILGFITSSFLIGMKNK